MPALGNPTWMSEGPAPINNDGLLVSGSVNAIAVDPSNPARVFIASSDGGVWRTTNATSATPTWTPLTDQLPFLGTTDVAFSPLDPTHNTLYVGTGRVSSSYQVGGPAVGLYLTTDANDSPPTWTQLGQATFTGLTITSVVPTGLTTPGTGAQVLLVSTNTSPSGGNNFAPANAGANGLYRSPDGGQTWSLVSGAQGTGLPTGGVSQVVADYANPNQPVFYAAVIGSGIYASNNGGQTWTALPSQPGDATLAAAQAARIRLAVHNSPGPNGTVNDVLYAGLINSNNALTGVFRSPDQGANWAALGLPPAGNISGDQGNLHFAIVADPTDPNTVYIGGSTTSLTANGYVGIHYRGTYAATGTTWDSLDNDGANNTYTHPDSRTMVFDTNGNLLEGDGRRGPVRACCSAATSCTSRPTGGPRRSPWAA